MSSADSAWVSAQIFPVQLKKELFRSVAVLLCLTRDPESYANKWENGVREAEEENESKM